MIEKEIHAETRRNTLNLLIMRSLL